MLFRDGFPYISTDVTQAFYLTQNRLENELCGDVDECIESLDKLNERKEKSPLHIPYWKLWELRNNDLEADIIISNRNLSEIHERALCFYLQYGKHLMRNSQYKLLYARGMGGGRGMGAVLSTFKRMGYELLYRDEDYFFVFGLQDDRDIKKRKIRIMNCMIESADRIEKLKKVALEDIEKYFSSLDENVDTPDEEFIHYIGCECI